MINLRLVLIIGTLWIVTMNTSAQAVRYELKEGGQYALCNAYKKNLERFSADLPMVCERRLDPDLKDFSKPQWNELEPLEHMDVLKEIWRVQIKKQLPRMQKKIPDITWEKTWGSEMWGKNGGENRYRAAIKAGELTLSVAQIDLLYDGKLDTVYRFSEHQCDDEKQLAGVAVNPYTYRYFVVDSRELSKLRDDVFAGMTTMTRGLFYYKGRPYFDSFDGYGIGTRAAKVAEGKKGYLQYSDASLQVFEPSRFYPVAPTVCRFDIWYEINDPKPEIEK